MLAPASHGCTLSDSHAPPRTNRQLSLRFAPFFPDLRFFLTIIHNFSPFVNRFAKIFKRDEEKGGKTKGRVINWGLWGSSNFRLNKKARPPQAFPSGEGGPPWRWMRRVDAVGNLLVSLNLRFSSSVSASLDTNGAKHLVRSQSDRYSLAGEGLLGACLYFL